MIPELNNNGYLPAGIYPATLQEIEARFGTEPELRRVELQSLRWLLDIAPRADIRRIIVNGSFVTSVWEPNDVDCILLMDDKYNVDSVAARELEAGLPFLQVDVVNQEQFDYLVGQVYASDRDRIPKGMLEVIAWQ
jgi:hypothetical protein